MTESYKKFLKYKAKYNTLKKLIGGGHKWQYQNDSESSGFSDYSAELSSKLDEISIVSLREGRDLLVVDLYEFTETYFGTDPSG